MHSLGTPDDGRKDRPKHVECHSKIKINLIHWCIWLVLRYKFVWKLQRWWWGATLSSCVTDVPCVGAVTECQAIDKNESKCRSSK